MNSDQRLFLSLGEGGIRRLIEDRNNYHLGFGIVVFQVRDFNLVRLLGWN